jgi:IS30 family transposase
MRQGLNDWAISEVIGRDRTVVWRERGWSSLKTRGYQPVSAQTRARKWRARPQERLIDIDPLVTARVRADLARLNRRGRSRAGCFRSGRRER